ncbi:RcnB family protein [Thermomonas hydrothermalis]|uniref:Regulator RcnB of Ni and Co efflux n=1 Tax=Thermomonas hydrothermalis TaxID=213588 RepID=A0A1M4SG71_9GAMM|nr:RcnB family protein [Thermomonas hydrothermalis]MCL6619119.1 RcnB family protein [Thermomonas hydrothermalis]SHE31264.1 regulator RcnB of Ni and Co efflux [Thermomonas hydrothermalis]
MKRVLLALLTAPLLLSLLSAPVAAHDRHGHDRDDRRGDWYDRDDHDRGWHHGPPHKTRVIYEREVVYRPLPPRVVVYRPLPPPRWVRGGYYAGPGYAPTYVVHDWRYYQLPPPPRGYYWRRSEAGDFLLVAVATGIIADLILHH